MSCSEHPIVPENSTQREECPLLENEELLEEDYEDPSEHLMQLLDQQVPGKSPAWELPPPPGTNGLVMLS